MLISFKMAWSEQETLCLIRLWSNDGIQAQIEGCKRNREVIDTLAAGMTDEGYVCTGVQCRNKIKKLKADYRKIKDNNNETGRQRRSTRIFEAMNEILGCRPATHPPVLLDTLEEELHVEVEEETLRSATEPSTPASAPGDVTAELPSREEIEAGSSQSQSFHVQNTTTKKKGLKQRYEDCKAIGRDAKMKDMTDTMMKTIKEVKEVDSSLLIELEERG